MLRDLVLVPVILFTLLSLASDDFLESVELLIEFLDHGLILLERVARFLILSQQSCIRFLQGSVLGALLVEGLGHFVELVLPLAGLCLNHGL